MQNALVGLRRSTRYYRPTPVPATTLRIMGRIDALYLEDPCSGCRRMMPYLAAQWIPTGLDRMRNLMRRLRLRAIYQRPRTTVPPEPSERLPGLVELNQITAVDQIWATDVTYTPDQKGVLYLVTVGGLLSRNVISL
jgi:putative transposase